jgi:protoheme IX farnesyltransferase
VYASTLAVVVASLLPLAFGAGPVYALGAIGGGLHFVHKSWRLARRPDRATAMGSFFASLVQLSVLLIAASIDGLMR